MAADLSTISYGSTGIKTYTVGFQPVKVTVMVGQKFATGQAFAHHSYGVGLTAANQRCDTHFQDTSSGITVSSDTKIVSVYERVSGTITEVLSIALDSFTATAVKFNVLTANANYQLSVLVEG